MYHKFAVVAILAIVPVVFGYSGGAPEGVCDDMTPKHPSPPQTSKFPYAVSLSENQIKAGGKTKITISGPAFKGFLLQVRDGDKPVGSFQIPDDSRYAKAISCSGTRNAATHKNSATKKDLTLDWTAPRAAAGKQYTVYATVATDGDTYWVRQPTESIKVA